VESHVVLRAVLYCADISEVKMTGYCVLVINGKNPAYRIVFKSSLPEALKAIPSIKAESEGRIEVLKMVDGDTRSLREVEANEYIED